MLDVQQQPVVRKRDGRVVPFDQNLICTAIEKAFRADRGLSLEDPLPEEIATEISRTTDEVVSSVYSKALSETGTTVEEVQDVVEMQLMRFGHYRTAKRYILYREDQAKRRKLRGGEKPSEESKRADLSFISADGSKQLLLWDSLESRVRAACEGLEECSASEVMQEVSRSVYNDISERELDTALILAARSKIEKEPAYSVASSRLLLNVIYQEAFNIAPPELPTPDRYRNSFSDYVKLGVNNDRLAPDLLRFDLDKLGQALDPSRDNLFLYIGLQTVYDRYLIHIDGRRFETPQYFWMRAAMGLALAESENREERAIEFYNVLSTFRFVSSTPTLFNSGTLHPQLSSCYLSTISDDLAHIYKVVSDNAQLSKWAGGIGNDWTNVRATGARIKGTNGESQGVIPFLKVANDTAIAVNQGGKRKGAVCAYLETWHLEIEEFLELRKNTGDDRRRTHDMNTANWIPDLFMKRVAENGTWTLLSPNEASDLHDLYGKDFEKRYLEYERLAGEGKLRQFKQIPAAQLWRKMLSMLFETGHPWITFKDPSNIRSPQSHVGVVHSSNLCTEILLNTSAEETAVCNLGSVNLAAHVDDTGLSELLLADTIRTALRMLDDVIDINYYPTAEARTSNLKHRPVGLGVMGFQDALYKQRISYASEGAVEFADASMEMISFYAILASAELAKERGTYSSYKGSKWEQGIIPIDSIDILEKERGGHVDVDRRTRLDWDKVRTAIRENGMRNSNVMAIAPTATIANIAGVYQSIEPAYRHLFVKSNLSGEFISVNPYLVEDLKAINIWDDEMIDDLKYYDGVVTEIERIPDAVKHSYLTAFEIDPEWLIECASRRQKWIDMGQSLNLYIDRPDGRVLSDMYMNAWKKGLKTTYYLRSVAATQIEKSSMDINRRGVQPRWMKSKSASSGVVVDRTEANQPQISGELQGGCEACE